MGYVIGDYHFLVVIDMKTKKVRSISVFKLNLYISIDFKPKYRGAGRCNACNKDFN